MTSRWETDEPIREVSETIDETTDAVVDNRLASMVDYDTLLAELKEVNTNLVSIIELLGG